MNKKYSLLLTFFIALAMLIPTATVLADSPPAASWFAQYYTNPNLEGNPAQTNYTTAIWYDWGKNIPLEGIPADNFSVRWTASTDFTGGAYTFKVTVDDGVRLWIDGQLALDEWHQQAPTTYTVQKYIAPGVHQLQMAYFESQNLAVAKLTWQLDTAIPDPVNPTNPNISWEAKYFTNITLSGDPAKTVTESTINHDWSYYAPFDDFPNDCFSVRWTANINFPAGTYTFKATVDDGVRLWIDGEPVIDQWKEQSLSTFTAPKTLSAGIHRVQMAYFEATGEAVAKLWWDLTTPGSPATPPASCHTPCAKPQPGGGLSVDNLDPGFVWGGNNNRHTAPGGQGNSFYWTKNTTTNPENYGKWTPTFKTGGNYEVLVFIPGTNATSTAVRYRIMHHNQRHDVTVDQSWYSDQWVSLGTYTFTGNNTGQEFIVAYDNTREPYATTAIAFDALKLEPR